MSVRGSLVLLFSHLQQCVNQLPAQVRVRAAARRALVSWLKGAGGRACKCETVLVGLSSMEARAAVDAVCASFSRLPPRRSSPIFAPSLYRPAFLRRA
jgi:hypothetical protein